GRADSIRPHRCAADRRACGRTPRDRNRDGREALRLEARQAARARDAISAATAGTGRARALHARRRGARSPRPGGGDRPLIGLAHLGGPIACLALALLLVAKTRRERIAGLAFAAFGACVL